MAKWIQIRDEKQFDNEVRRGPVAVIFGSSSNMTWSGEKGPIEMFVRSVPASVRFLYVEKEELPALVQKQNVRVIPSARFLNNGKKVGELNGEDVNVDNFRHNLEKLQDAEEQEV